MVQVQRKIHTIPPWDVLELIFNHLSKRSLAALSRVSFAYLVVASPLLYERIEIRSMRSLKKLFCGRREGRKWWKKSKFSEASRINPYLSLNQIRTLQVNLASINWSYVPSVALSTSRLDSDLLPIPLDLLRITFPCDQLQGFSQIYKILLPSLNPERVELVVPDSPYEQSNGCCLNGFSPLTSWTRIEVIDLQGVIPFVSTLDGQVLLAGILPPASDPSSRPRTSRTIKLHVPTLLSAHFPTPLALVRLVSLLDKRIWIDQLGDGSILLVVRSEEAKEEAERAVGSLDERFRTLFVVENLRSSERDLCIRHGDASRESQRLFLSTG